MKSTLLLHTGGTIGMIETANGYAPKAGVVEDALEKICADDGLNPPTVLRLDPLIDSANANYRDWNRLMETIMDHIDDYDGFIITHGTDTMAFTTAAICMALEGVEKPILLTGSMKPLTVDESDGWANLRDALQTIDDCPAGVWVQFAGERLHGARVRKLHSSANDAFKAAPTIDAPYRAAQTPTRHIYTPSKVSILPVAPNAATDVIAFAAQNHDAIILRCFGSGTVPDDRTLREALQTAQKRNIPVLAISECLGGGTKLGTYAAGAMLVEHAVIDGGDMTLETAYAKLSLALSLFQNHAEIASFLTTPVSGEFWAATPTPR